MLVSEHTLKLDLEAVEGQGVLIFEVPHGIDVGVIKQLAQEWAAMLEDRTLDQDYVGAFRYIPVAGPDLPDDPDEEEAPAGAYAHFSLTLGTMVFQRRLHLANASNYGPHNLEKDVAGVLEELLDIFGGAESPIVRLVVSEVLERYDGVEEPQDQTTDDIAVEHPDGDISPEQSGGAETIG